MTRIRYLPLLFLLACLVFTNGCAKTTTTGTPTGVTPPQITVANSVGAFLAACDGAVTTSIAARDAGKVDAADVRTIENVCRSGAVAMKKVDAELRTADTWAVQRVQILQIVAGLGLGEVKAHVSPAAQVLIATVVLVVNQISSAVGGPTI
jgi:hypothetical protein